jgi:hypothetical protein
VVAEPKVAEALMADVVVHIHHAQAEAEQLTAETMKITVRAAHT